MEQRIGEVGIGNEQCLLPDGDRDFCTSIEVRLALLVVALSGVRLSRYVALQ